MSSRGAVKRWGVFQHPQVVLGAIALFGYVGVEVIAGDTIGLYGRELGVAHYGVLTSYTMGFMVLGYLLGVLLIPRRLSQRGALLLSAGSGLLFSAGIALTSASSTAMSQALFGWAGVPPVPDTVLCLALLGLSNALVWPSVWPLALEGLGRYTAAGSALLIMGIAGGALIPHAVRPPGGRLFAAAWLLGHAALVRADPAVRAVRQPPAALGPTGPGFPEAAPG